jgi:tRNA1Val (adenine37-N6)-methyltransferase
MPNNYFQFKQFTITQNGPVFKVGTDGVLLGAAADVSESHRILDIGAGTGLISIMLAQRCNAEIVALEPDYDSFMQLNENVDNCNWKERIKAVNCTLQDYQPGNRFDTIVSNPPFFIDSLKNPDPVKSSSRHTDSLSQDDILQKMSELLEDTGTLQLILPYAEGNIFIAKSAGFDLFCNKLVKVKPLPASEVKRLIMIFSRTRTILHESFLTIETGPRHNYTDEYKELTSRYYLKF